MKKITKLCPKCKKEHTLNLQDEEYEAYARRSEPIQNVLPDLNKFEREFLLTGYCCQCQSKIFRSKLPEDVSRWSNL